ncbi:hypothetical protein [Pantoea sp.]|uniref:hypothetical protein n=1 Tax=Pantoea sp. TaxID=69393 RepID=UPI0028A61228|nr:hypothetical protein [Pantoea sp.]
MTNQKTNRELVQAGHALANALGADSPLMEVAKLVSDISTRLDVAVVRGDELQQKLDAMAVENGVMLRLLTDISENHVEYFSEGEDGMFAGVPLDFVSEINMYVSRDVNTENPFPASDAYLNSLRAEGVIQLGSFAGQEYKRFAGDKVMQRKWKGIVLLCADFAHQLCTVGQAVKDGE